MNFVIIGIYDSWYYHSININGKLYDNDNELSKELYHIYWDSDDWNGENAIKAFHDYLLKTFKDYDLIAICEDGYTTIIKGAANIK